MSSSSLEAEVRAALAADGGEGPADQLGLEFGDMPSPVQQLADAKGLQLRRGPGRPPGSRNRANVDVVRYLKATGRPTLLTLRDWASLPLDEFKRLTGIDDADKAFARWLQVAELVMAYEEGRPTQRLDVSGQAVAIPVLMMADEPVRPDLAHGNPPIEGEYEEIQRVSPPALEQVAQLKSHDEPEAIDWQEESDA